MRISVVIPCFNSQAWVADALRSAAAQTYGAEEIIVIDDGSTDDSVARIQSSEVDVRLIHTDRANGAGARNAGIEIACGDWIAFLDADDRWLPNHLKRAVDLLRDTNDIAYLGHCFTFNDSKPDTLFHEPLPWPITCPSAGLTHDRFIEMYARTMRFSMPSTVVRRDRLVEIGGFDSRLVRRHDIDMWLRAIAGHTWSLDPEPTVEYRRDTPESISRSHADANYYHLAALLKNRQSYAGRAMDGAIRMMARRAVASALSYGSSDELDQAAELAWPHLSWRDALMLSIGRLAPAPFRAIHRWRHRRIQQQKPCADT